MNCNKTVTSKSFPATIQEKHHNVMIFFPPSVWVIIWLQPGSCSLIACQSSPLKDYLTRKFREMAPGFLEKSCSRTLRSICSHLHWPLQRQTSSSVRKLRSHTSLQLFTSAKERTSQCTYLSSKKARPKNSFSFRLKWDDTKSRSS